MRSDRKINEENIVFDSDMKHPNSCTSVNVPVVRRALVDKVADFICSLEERALSGDWSQGLDQSHIINDVCIKEGLIICQIHCLKNTTTPQGRCMTSWLLLCNVKLHTHAAVNIQGMSSHPYRSCTQCLVVFTGFLAPVTKVAKLHTRTTMFSLISIFCLVLWRAVCCSFASKESKSFQPTQQGDFQPHIALKSNSKHKTQRLVENKGVIQPFFLSHPFSVWTSASSVSLWSAQVHFSSQKPVSPLSSANVRKYLYLLRGVRFDPGFVNKIWLILIATLQNKSYRCEWCPASAWKSVARLAWWWFSFSGVAERLCVRRWGQ